MTIPDFIDKKTHERMVFIYRESLKANGVLCEFKNKYRDSVDKLSTKLRFDNTNEMFYLEVQAGFNGHKMLILPFLYRSIDVKVIYLNKSNYGDKPMNINVNEHTLLTPNKVVLNKNEDTTIFKRDGSSIILPANEQMELDLHNVVGIKASDYNLVFRNHKDKEIEKIKKTEGSLQVLYYYMNFEVGDWVSVTQHNELTFFDAVYDDSQYD